MILQKKRVTTWEDENATANKWIVENATGLNADQIILKSSSNNDYLNSTQPKYISSDSNVESSKWTVELV